ncbi:MAG: MBL fold metallo-hydrolase [Acidobacteria bacterium]|nr:MBL fold metallo-hydrolase [Acidobacteriota bacterium]
MKLVVLGSGTSVPHAARAAAGYWLETETGRALLDIGSDTPHRMAQEELDWVNLDAIWLSHFHLDHIGGLAPFLFGTRSAPQTQQRVQPLSIYGPVGFSTILNAIDQANHYRLLEQPFPVELNEVAPGKEFELLPDLKAVSFSTPHTRESLAIRLQDKSGRVLVYTSDTGYSDELIEFAKGAGLLLMECSFRHNKPVKTHLELAEAMQLARKCQPQMLVLSHLYAEWDGIDLASEAQQHWPGKTIAAFDGLRLDF